MKLTKSRDKQKLELIKFAMPPKVDIWKVDT